MRLIQSLLLVIFLKSSSSSIVNDIINGEPNIPQNGRICACADMDKNRYSDLIVQQGNELVILTQNEDGVFEESLKFDRIKLDSSNTVFCSIGDFDGDASPDIMVVKVSYSFIDWDFSGIINFQFRRC